MPRFVQAPSRPSMRDLVVTENITLDGVIDSTEGWFAPGDDDQEIDLSDVVDAIRVQREAADAVLFGRVTFEEMRGYWPELTDDTTGIADYLNKVTKHVVSSGLHEPCWENTNVLRGPLREEIVALKAEEGGDIVATGSMSVVTQLIAEGWSTSTGCSSTPSCSAVAIASSRM
jgi:dihydrofolate reductase